MNFLLLRCKVDVKSNTFNTISFKIPTNTDTLDIKELLIARENLIKNYEEIFLLIDNIIQILQDYPRSKKTIISLKDLKLTMSHNLSGNLLGTLLLLEEILSIICPDNEELKQFYSSILKYLLPSIQLLDKIQNESLLVLNVGLNTIMDQYKSVSNLLETSIVTFLETNMKPIIEEDDNSQQEI